jgi:hypothetical protein
MKTRLQLLDAPHEVHESILVDETIAKFGYDPRLLKAASQKLVVKRFGCCGLVADRGYRAASQQHSCQRCANKRRSIETASIRSERIKTWLKTHTHSRLGIKHTAESKAKMSASQRGRVIPPETRIKWMGKKLSPESRAKLSQALMGKPCPQKALDYWKDPAHLGVNHHRYGVRPPHAHKVWYTCQNGMRICFRSTWEARVARHFDEQGTTWEYETKMFPVSYEWNGSRKESTYRSDFWLPSLGCYVEVKGLWREEYATKFRAFREQYPEVVVEVWDRAVLRSKGIRTGYVAYGEFNEDDVR